MSESAPTSTGLRAQKIAQRLNHLIEVENVRRASKTPPQAPVGIPELAERSDGVLSETQLRYLKRGYGANNTPTNPTVVTLDALGRLFGLANGASYFTSDDTSAIDRQLDGLNSLARLRGTSGAVEGGDSGLGILQRAMGLKPANFDILVGMARRMVELEEEAAARAPKGHGE
ncbi:hypothetical protein [Streptomyces sp. MJM8645]|uniref:hypothetical protein n=1 Tax=Streptomycetaceae TaxID=2062 RepID=UPI0007AFA203|nr:hypothetical protein [Streptomyces sp. MJM8645]